MAGTGKRETYSEDLKIDQRPDITGDDDLEDRESPIIQVDASIAKKEYLDELAFNEEPVTVQLIQGSEPNAATKVPFWVNGKGCEVLFGGKWIEVTYIEIGPVFVTKRKYLETLIRAKLDRITTSFGKPGDENPQNKVRASTSSFQSFQVIKDKNPRGAAWLAEMRRRNF